MQDTQRFDLIEITAALRKRRGFIIGLTVAAAIVGAVFYVATKKQYKATVEFLIANPQYTDRQNIFRQDRAAFIAYFATEDDIDKVMALAKSHKVQEEVIAKTDLPGAYGLDPAKQEDEQKLWSRFIKSFDAKRTDLQNVTVSYTDPDPKIAMRVANESVKSLETAYSAFFTSMRMNALHSLEAKMHDADSSITSLTDSLANLRDRFHIYDVFSGTSNGNGARTAGAGYGAAIEQVRNIESIKDQLVADRARLTSLATEFSTGSKAGDLPLIQVITPATLPEKPAGLGLALTIVACALVALLFSIVWVLMTGYYRMIVGRKV